jgi:superfamily II DNA or RNA helicase
MATATSITLRPYQHEALAAVQAAEHRGVRRPLLALPTGTGKTVIFSHLIAQRPGRSLILVHRDELIRQAYAKLKEVSPALSIGIVKAEANDHAAPCVVASVQTLARESRLHRLQPDFGTIVVDEAHHAVADSYRRILDHCGAFSEHGPLCLGVTATPRRRDNIGLDNIFQEVIYHKGILEMIGGGYLADLRAIQLRLKADFHALHTRMGDFVDSEIENLLLEANAPKLIVNAYLEHARDRKTLLFGPTVKFAHGLASLFLEAGIAAAALDGATPPEERRAILKRLHTGETSLVANCGVLTEGFDEPSVDCILIARPTKSTALFTQMVGRGTRLYPGKRDCLVIDVAGVSRRHDLASVASITGLPLDALESGQSVSEVVEAIAQEEVAKQERSRRRGEVVAEAVDLFKRRPLNWLPQGQFFTLSLGTQGWLLLSPTEEDPDKWNVHQIDEHGKRETLAAGLSLPYAQGSAEDYARKLGASALVNPQAPWRQRPASDKQIYLLHKLRIPTPPILTAGEASDLISRAKMEQALGAA